LKDLKYKEIAMENNWFDSVDIYCERMSSAFWAEPVNAITNIFFIIAGILALRLWKNSAARSWETLVMALLILVVGAGSFTFHTVATRWAGLADVLPIAFFIHFSFGVFLYRVANAGLMASMLGVFAFALYSLNVPKYIPIEVLNRSGQYVGAITLLFGISAYCYLARIRSAKYFALAFIVFAISLTLRSLDMAVCESFPVGIHFMWHVLNSVVMFLVFKGVISYSRISVNV
jgi:hypothetical protein